ncbi:MAG: hypothetical protein JO262_23125 [Solirubrobacterales bacterium]|nr:hypothetical protein [Solirubrobacterales bacterium]
MSLLPRSAALAALVSGYDTGAWNDPVSKLQLLFDLDRIRGLLHAGQDIFDPDRDREPFLEHVLAKGCHLDTFTHALGHE